MFHHFYDKGFCVYAVDPYKREDELVAYSANLDAAIAAMKAMRPARPHSGLELRNRAHIHQKLEPLEGWIGKPPPDW